MPEIQTKPTNVAVEEFIAGLDDPAKRAGSHKLIDMMSRLTGAPAKMWGPAIIGFGTYHYKYASGHEGDSCVAGFSPRKAEFSIYLNASYALEYVVERDELLSRLGKHRMGKGCLYVKRLEEVDLKALEKLIRQSIEAVRSTYPSK
jgi:hypothetical protein